MSFLKRRKARETDRLREFSERQDRLTEEQRRQVQELRALRTRVELIRRGAAQ
jgi:hypothetical protein